MKVNIFCPTEPSDHVASLNAMAEGILKAGDESYLCPLDFGYVDCDIAIVFGVGKRVVDVSHPRGAIIYEHHFRAKKDIVILERGFINREKYYGVALNGLNGLGDFFNENSPADRWEAHGMELVEIQNSRYMDQNRKSKPPHSILIAGQVPWDASVQHSNHKQWCQDTFKFCQENSDRKVVFRPHPSVRGFDYGIPGSEKSFDEDIKSASVVVTFNSTTAALCALKGIPIFTLDKGSIAYDIGMRNLTKENLESPAVVMPGKLRQWAYDLCYAQWTFEEMASGIVWERITDRLEMIREEKSDIAYDLKQHAHEHGQYIRNED